jgi:hypothetical protein
MIVRLKLDTIGIKLPLKAWSRFSKSERNQLALDPCETETENLEYKDLVLELAKNHSIEDLGNLRTLGNPGWDNPDCIPESLLKKFRSSDKISISQWSRLPTCNACR